MVTLWNLIMACGMQEESFFGLQSWHTCSIPPLILFGEGGGGGWEIATSNPPSTLRTFCPNPMTPHDPKPLCAKEATKWMGLGLGANPIRFPWTLALDILQTLLMSCPTPCMVLSWAFGSLRSMTTSIGNGNIILLYISTCTK
jgi:hypothetical protein